ncbi:hypothetical protein [Marinitenerispora sediminis]|uniref:Uncharacterized protein n=1 Tax=Marinitenerispora sediminis TaxID=1931232 RepID=A0A368T235_9ACTN|nr:hypothetical protein [Marinitenerispora sediminis]RCV49213.1 hypothetical protein DEF28_21510 [Marinitenerispora sediminis]RCV51546.1 hypothetical protein DEF23_20270 [Marinitenerispora sediminis]RCV55127.1 hypothetical protein DEF24_18450 [Marinitenerispora sediminis]
MEPWWVALALAVVAELGGLAAVWLRLRSRERLRRHEAAARIAAARVVAGGGRVAEYHPDGTEKVVIEVRSIQ